MGAQLGTKGGFNDINMTPLIDIVLVVLIIMMVNIPIQIEEMGLKLPSTKVQPPQDPPPDSEQLVIALYKPETEGAAPKVALNRRVMSQDKMLYEITRRLKPMTNKNVFIDADVDVEYGLIVDLVDLARSAGAANVGLAKMKPEGPLPPTSVDQGAGMPRGILLGSPQVAGEMTEKLAYASIQPLQGSIQQCYLQRLAAVPDLTGSMSIYVEVGPDGAFLKELAPAIEADSVGDADLNACILNLLPNLRYKPLGDQKTAWIRYPVLFSPG
ncbi:MAG: biopolymer transporter ExbD [Myxococcota bacterium]